MLECKIGCLGPQRGQLPSTTQQMTNNGRSFALPITVRKSVSKGFCSAQFLFPIAGKSLLQFSVLNIQLFVKLAFQPMKQSGIFK